MSDLSDGETSRMSLSDPDVPGNPEEAVGEAPDEARENSGEDEEKRRIDPSASKKKIIRREIPKLNPARLTGPKGVATIEKYFEGFKFKGKGHEKIDLDRVMKRLEHWAHRLFPKYQFDDFLERVEALGPKREIQTHLKKYRMDMLIGEDHVTVDHEEEEGEREKSPEPEDEFDKLIAEQIEKTRQSSQGMTPGGIRVPQAPRQQDDEVKRRMEENRKIALERRQARMREREGNSLGTGENAVHGDLGGSQKTGEEGEVQGRQEVLEDPGAQVVMETHGEIDEEEEIKKRIERNRQAALERRQARMKETSSSSSQRQEVFKDYGGNRSSGVSGGSGDSGPLPGEDKAGDWQQINVLSGEHVENDNHGTGVEVEGDVDGMDIGEELDTFRGEKLDIEESNESKMDVEEKPEPSTEERNLEFSGVSNVSHSGVKTNASRKLLTDEELDQEIGAAVDKFIKGNRTSLQ
ncbi:TIMELESS-interacting protein [Fopius arisanus]|uniref:TIMELESS-interacting protein n=1 Tax=Fopius arisanus TaxID=64838 RepID=A0A9R1SZG1_9HYME|nr:PREDICTED: TIMELESS-interacting protein [Fopius arisanus]